MKTRFLLAEYRYCRDATTVVRYFTIEVDKVMSRGGEWPKQPKLPDRNSVNNAVGAPRLRMAAATNSRKWMPPFRFHQCRRQIDLQLELPLLALAGIRQFGNQPHPPSQVCDRLDKTRFHGGLLTGPRPIRDCLVDEARLCEMVRENLRLSLYNTPETLFERVSDPCVQRLARSTQQQAVRGLLYQGMLEEERGLRLRPRCKNEPPVDEASHCLVQFRLSSLSDHRQQLV